MGSLVEKLEYLAETKEAMKTAFQKKRYPITDETPFREYVDKVREVLDFNIKIAHYAQGISHLDFEADEDGIYTNTTRGITYRFAEVKQNHYSGVGNMIVPDGATVEQFPSSFLLKAIGYTSTPLASTPLEGYSVIDNSRLQCGDTSYVMSTAMGTTMPSFLAVADIAYIHGAVGCLINNNYATESGYHPHVLHYGLSFGKKVTGMASYAIKNDLSGYGEKPVYVLEGFEGTIYLSKISMSAETMVNIFNNLADMSATTTTYTLNIGSTNLEKLTDEEIAIAESKGWAVT